MGNKNRYYTYINKKENEDIHKPTTEWGMGLGNKRHGKG